MIRKLVVGVWNVIQIRILLCSLVGRLEELRRKSIGDELQARCEVEAS